VQSISQGGDDEVLVLCGSEAFCFLSRGSSAAESILSRLQTGWMEWMRRRQQQQQQQPQQPHTEQQAAEAHPLHSPPPIAPQCGQGLHQGSHQSNHGGPSDHREPEEERLVAAAASGSSSLYLDSVSGGDDAHSSSGGSGMRGRQCIECYENQRWYPLTGWSSRLLPTDRPAWSDEAGLTERTKYSFDFLDLDLEGLSATSGGGAASGGMDWELAWEVDQSRPDADADGWLYAVDFPSAWGTRIAASFVRRRRWVPARAEAPGSVGTHGELSHAAADRCKICDTFENQRWLPVVGWSSRLLPTDRCAWSDEFGHLDLPLLAFDHWLQEGWVVREGWCVDSGDWQYATDFPSLDWTPSSTALSCVRRRRWTAVLVRGGGDNSDGGGGAGTIPMARDVQRRDTSVLGSEARAGTCMFSSASESVMF
jgi:hypothetical protein